MRVRLDLLTRAALALGKEIKIEVRSDESKKTA